MEAVNTISYTLDDADNFVEDFITKNLNNIRAHWTQKYTSSTLGFEAFIAELRPKLKNSCITFLNSNYDLATLHAYLFPTVITLAKQEQAETIKKIAVHICPACKFLGIEQPLSTKRLFKCSLCEERLQTPASLQEYKLSAMFCLHNKHGYKCPDCERFIPHPLDSSREIICPYFDCCFVGNMGQLVKTRHPTIMQKVNFSSLDVNINSTNLTGKDLLQSGSISSDSQLELKETIKNHIALLIDIIESQINALYYTSSNFTRIHNIQMYEAFKVILNKFPEEMISYLVFLKRGEGLQHFIFQEYVSLLEKNLPFGFKKNGKNYKITSLLDESLCIFDGISTFDAIVSEKKEIKNGTKEFYIGGRSAAYSKPYYMGKLLDVLNKDNISILKDVKEYSFSKIKLLTTNPGTQVKVIHLRIPPHYQMGGMVYLNRIRRKIVDKVYLTLNGSKREILKK